MFLLNISTETIVQKKATADHNQNARLRLLMFLNGFHMRHVWIHPETTKGSCHGSSTATAPDQLNTFVFFVSFQYDQKKWQLQIVSKLGMALPQGRKSCKGSVFKQNLQAWSSPARNRLFRVKLYAFHSPTAFGYILALSHATVVCPRWKPLCQVCFS